MQPDQRDASYLWDMLTAARAVKREHRAILASVMRTAQQQGRDVVEAIQTLLKAHWSGKEATLLTDLLMPAILQNLP